MGFFSDSFSLSFSLLHRFTRHGESAMKCELFLAAALLVATFVAVPVEDDDEVELDDDECDCSKYTWDFCQKLEKEFLANKKTCRWKSKDPFSDCSETCGDGVQTRPRRCVCTFGYGNANCEGEPVETKPCNLGACPVVTEENVCVDPLEEEIEPEIVPAECELGKWTPFPEVCAGACDSIGTKTRTRGCECPPNALKTCDDYVLEETTPCETEKCPEEELHLPELNEEEGACEGDEEVELA